MKKRLSTLYALLILTVLTFCMATVASAADVTAQQTITDTLQQSVFPVIGSIILGFVSWALSKLGTTLGIQALTQKNNILIQIAAQGVAYAEEKAAGYLGSKSTLTGSQKMDTAVAFICQALPKVTTDEAERAATAVLAMIPGVGATGATSVSLTGAQVAPVAVPGLSPADVSINGLPGAWTQPVPPLVPAPLGASV